MRSPRQMQPKSQLPRSEKSEKALNVKLTELVKQATILSEETRLAIEESRRLRAAMRRLTAAMEKLRERLANEQISN